MMQQQQQPMLPPLQQSPPSLQRSSPALHVKLTDNVLRSFQVSRNFDCSLICCEAAQKMPGCSQGCMLPGLPSAAKSPPSSSLSNNSSDNMDSGTNSSSSTSDSSSNSSSREKWRVTSGHWSQDGSSIILAVVCCSPLSTRMPRCSSDSSSSSLASSGSNSSSSDSSRTVRDNGGSSGSSPSRLQNNGDPVAGEADGETDSATAAAPAAATAKPSESPAESLSLSSAPVGGETSKDDPRYAKILLFAVQTGRLAYVHRTGFRRIDAVRYVQGGTRKCLIAVDEPKCAVVLWDFASNRLERHYPLPSPAVPHLGLDIHPTNDLFLASCLDGTVLLLHLSNSQALGCVRGPPCCPVGVFDCEGLVYACSLGNQQIHLFGCDDDTLGREPAGQFSSFDLSSTLAPASYITSLAFSPDEKTLLVGSSRTQILAIDAFSGSKLYELRAAQPVSPLSPHAAGAGNASAALPAAAAAVCPVTLSPDSRFVVWGDAAGCIYIWRTSSRSAGAAAEWQQEQEDHDSSNSSSKESSACSWKEKEEDEMLVQKRECHDACISFLLFSPTHAIFASVAGDILALWQPPPPASSMQSPTMRV